MKVIIKIDGKNDFEITDLTALENKTAQLDRDGIDYDLEFVTV